MFDEYKDVSFWGIVLFCVTAMIIHHIVSGSDIIEGARGAPGRAGRRPVRSSWKARQNARKRSASQTRTGRTGSRRGGR
jgi:hypothetical protein